jgi:hypothetical protein
MTHLIGMLGAAIYGTDGDNGNVPTPESRWPFIMHVPNHFMAAVMRNLGRGQYQLNVIDSLPGASSAQYVNEIVGALNTRYKGTGNITISYSTLGLQNGINYPNMCGVIAAYVWYQLYTHPDNTYSVNQLPANINPILYHLFAVSKSLFQPTQAKYPMPK